VRWTSWLALALALCALGACESQKQRVQDREDNLAAAGFIIHPANTPDRKTMLAALPPHQFITRINGDVVHYVYADPLVCACLYIGTQQAYDLYKRHQLEQHLADERQMTAQIYANPTWTWSAWGPPPYGTVLTPYGFVYSPGFGW
jgi:hypothetical protein